MENKYQQLKLDVYDEINEIELTVIEISALRTQIAQKPVDNVQKAAMGTFLMNFYVGIENIIKRITKVYYQKVPMGHSWHRELIELAMTPPPGKLQILDKVLVDKLNPYRGFRHVFVSGYGFKLKIELMTSLINGINTIWDELKKAINQFWDSFESLPHD
jgi:hypothetical protein